VVYAYNEETKQYIGQLFDKSERKDMNLFRKEHSIPFKEALVFNGSELVDMFIKECDL
jgi:hypothetical protein